MLLGAIVLFLLAALFGIYMILRVFAGAVPPWGAVILHGLLAASGLVLVCYAWISGAQAMPVTAAAVLLVVAALGGFVMFTFQLRKQAPPKALAAIHALAALAGVGVLAANVFGYI